MIAWRMKDLKEEHRQLLSSIAEQFSAALPTHEISEMELLESDSLASELYGDFKDSASEQGYVNDVALAFASRYGDKMSEAVKHEMITLQTADEDEANYKERYGACGEMLVEAPAIMPARSDFAKTPMVTQLKHLGVVLGLIIGFWLFCLIIG